jgi:hypothetical protein
MSAKHTHTIFSYSSPRSPGAAIDFLHDYTLTMRKVYAESLYCDQGATLDGLREAVMTLEDTAQITRRVFGSSHPIATGNERSLRYARAALRARETRPPSSPVASL